MSDVLWHAFWFILGVNVGLVAWGLLHQLQLQDEATTDWEPTIYPDIETRLYHGQVESRMRRG